MALSFVLISEQLVAESGAIVRGRNGARSVVTVGVERYVELGAAAQHSLGEVSLRVGWLQSSRLRCQWDVTTRRVFHNH